MSALGHLRRLQSVQIYRQAAGRQPSGTRMADGEERLELVTGGRGWVQHAGAWHEVTAGTLVWNVCGDTTIKRSDDADPYRCLAVQVAVARGGARLVPRLTRWDDLADVHAFSERLVRLWHDRAADREAVSLWAYGRALLQARLWLAHADDAPLPIPLRRVRDAIEGRYAEDLDIDTLAGEAGWSPTHLHASFRQHLHTTPHRYLLGKRIDAARRMLTTTEHDLATIAVSVGLATPQALCRAFKAAVGITPAQYRRKPVER